MGIGVVTECVCVPRAEQVFSSVKYEEVCICSVMLTCVNTFYFGLQPAQDWYTAPRNVLEVLQILFDRCLRKTDLV